MSLSRGDELDDYGEEEERDDDDDDDDEGMVVQHQQQQVVRVAARRKREVLGRGALRVGRMGVLAASAGFGVDARMLDMSCGVALRLAMAALLVVSKVLEKVALWFLIRAYGVVVWTMKTLLWMLDWIGATY